MGALIKWKTTGLPNGPNNAILLLKAVTSWTMPDSSGMEVKMLKKIIILVAAILVALLVLRFFIYVMNCNGLYENVETVLKEETMYFNPGSKIRYEDLSNRLKKYITEEEFYNLHTWYDAYCKFRQIPKTDN